MKTRFALAAAGMLLATQIKAQQPPAAPQPSPESPITQPVAETMPFDIPYRKAIAAAEGEAGKHGWKLVCAVADASGDLIALERMDGAQLGSIQVAQDKARTAARFRRPTKAFLDALKGGNLFVMNLPGVITAEGGFPIVRGGKLIGAIGCSGAISNQDATAAMAGLEAVK
jgi:uncharacterized protein GlcG (DUF336 family)